MKVMDLPILVKRVRFRFENPTDEHVAEETDEEIVLMKDTKVRCLASKY